MKFTLRINDTHIISTTPTLSLSSPPPNRIFPSNHFVLSLFLFSSLFASRFISSVLSLSSLSSLHFVFLFLSRRQTFSPKMLNFIWRSEVKCVVAIYGDGAVLVSSDGCCYLHIFIFHNWLCKYPKFTLQSFSHRFSPISARSLSSPVFFLPFSNQNKYVTHGIETRIQIKMIREFSVVMFSMAYGFDFDSLLLFLLILFAIPLSLSLLRFLEYSIQIWILKFVWINSHFPFLSLWCSSDEVL